MSDNWHSLNGIRAYPLADNATQMADDGTELPAGIIADLRVILPYDIQPQVWVSGVSITDHLLSVVLSADECNKTPIALLSVPRSDYRHRVYNMSPLVPGVAALLTFGDTALRYSGRFSDWSQGAVTPTSILRYPQVGVQGIKKRGLAATLHNNIRLIGQGVLQTQAQYVNVEGEYVRALVIRMTASQDRTAALRDFAGPCAARPDSDTCANAPVERVGSVGPDCEGNINLEFRGIDSEFIDVEGKDRGVILSSEIGLADACASINRTFKGVNLCNPDEDDNFEIEYPDPGDIDPEVPIPCTGLPVSSNFTDVVEGGELQNPAYWSVISGFVYPGGNRWTQDAQTQRQAGSVIYVCDEHQRSNLALSSNFAQITPRSFMGTESEINIRYGILFDWRPYGELYVAAVRSLILKASRIPGATFSLSGLEIHRLRHVMSATGTTPILMLASSIPVATTIRQSDINALYTRAATATSRTTQESEAALGATVGARTLNLTMEQITGSDPGQKFTRASVSCSLPHVSLSLSSDLPDITGGFPPGMFGLWADHCAASSDTFSMSPL